jgi:FAD:protein FMN transferase
LSRSPTPRRGARWAAVLLAALLLAACGRSADEQETRHRFMAMGTLVDVTTWGMPRAEAEAAAAEVEALFHALHHAWDPWGDGALGRVNQALAAGEPAVLDEDLAALLAEAEALRRASGGLFDPAMGALVRLWGFASEEQQPTAPPPPAAIAAALAAEVPLFDLGGFLKGVAVDRGMALLRARGAEHAIVNAGGDLRAIGRRGARPGASGSARPARRPSSPRWSSRATRRCSPRATTSAGSSTPAGAITTCSTRAPATRARGLPR